MSSNTTLPTSTLTAIGDKLPAVALSVMVGFVLAIWFLVANMPKNAPHTKEVAQLPGPEKPWFSWLLGNAVALQNHRDSLIHPDWAAQSPTGRYLSLLSLERIYTFDPAAIRYVFNKVDEFERPPEARDVLGRVMGRGSLVAVNGAQHRRQRKVMDPAFNATAIKDMVPTIFEKADEMDALMARFVREDALESFAAHIPPKDIDRVPGKRKVDLLNFLGRVTTDVIGLCFFGHDFKSLSTPEGSELMRSFDRLVDAAHGVAPIFELQNSLPILDKVPMKNRREIDSCRALLETISTELIEKRRETLQEDDEDLFALMINSTLEEIEDKRMTIEETRDQMATMFFAGSTTTSGLLAAALYNLSCHPEYQERLRAEIMTIGEDKPSLDTLNTLPMLDAVIRETLRWSPPVTCTIRTATKDTVVPLAWPVTGRDGKVIENLPVKKGTSFFLSMMLLNRHKAVWGEDADKFNPDRFKDPSLPLLSVPGLWGDVSTFINGPYSCIGWRLSVVESKVVLFSLLRKFKFEELPSKPSFTTSRASPPGRWSTASRAASFPCWCLS